MLCFRLLNEDEPAAPLAAAVDSVRQGQPGGNVFDVDPVSFRQVPNAPFAYWVSENTRSLFTSLPMFEVNGRTVKQGVATADDFRFVRTAWEVPAQSSNESRVWFPFTKGGSFSPYYADIYLKVNWMSGGAEIKNNLNDKGGIKSNVWMLRDTETQYFFQVGITWPRRPHKRGAFSIVPKGVIFSDSGTMAFGREEACFSLSAILNSNPFVGLLHLLMPRGVGGNSGQTLKYEIGYVKNVPIPLYDIHASALTSAAQQSYSSARAPDTANLVSHAFFAPGLARSCLTLADGVSAWAKLIDTANSNIANLHARINDIAYRLYGIVGDDFRAIEQMLSNETPGVSLDSEDQTEFDEKVDDIALIPGALSLVEELLDYAIGCLFGRWDIRYSTAAKTPPPEPDPFHPLPACPSGMLQNAAGLPASPSEVPADYPLGITWPGILVDDERKPEDLARRVHEVLKVIFPGRADAITDEACAILGTKSLRDWFRSPSGFFAGHLKRHSKSRRQAPIYWPLSSPKGLYTVWLYLHRLSTDTFFTVLRDHVKPRLEDEERHVFNLKQQAGPSATPSQARDIAASEELVEDLRALRDELQHIAPLWRPDLNDGVIINHAPLWRIANHASWRKALKETWEGLIAGKYDWAHLAFHLWPERVIPKCAKDRSLAIAHGVEAFFWGADPKTGDVAVIPRTEAEVKALITERMSPAVKAALASLLTAPASVGGIAKRVRKKAG